jgi:hypothetical protein
MRMTDNSRFATFFLQAFSGKSTSGQSANGAELCECIIAQMKTLCLGQNQFAIGTVAQLKLVPAPLASSHSPE